MNCVNEGTVTFSSNYGAGIIGGIDAYDVPLTVTGSNLTNKGSIISSSGRGYVAGIISAVATWYESELTISLENVHNEGTLNASWSGDIISQLLANYLQEGTQYLPSSIFLNIDTWTGDKAYYQALENSADSKIEINL